MRSNYSQFSRIVGLVVLLIISAKSLAFSDERSTMQDLAGSPSVFASSEPLGNLKIAEIRVDPLSKHPPVLKSLFAMESVILRLLLRNDGETPINKDSLLGLLPYELNVDDFGITAESGAATKLSFDSDGGYWCHAIEPALKPKQYAQATIRGYFRSGGVKKISARSPGGSFTTMVRIEEDPGCIDGHINEKHLTPGWAYGGMSCVHESVYCDLGRVTHDVCSKYNPKLLNTFRCLSPARNKGKRRVYHIQFFCEHKCSNGTCYEGPDSETANPAPGQKKSQARKKSYKKPFPATEYRVYPPPKQQSWTLVRSTGPDELHGLSSPASGSNGR